MKKEERPEEAAQREVMEETSLTDLKLREPLGTIDWCFRFRSWLTFAVICATRFIRGNGVLIQSASALL